MKIFPGQIKNKFLKIVWDFLAAFAGALFLILLSLLEWGYFFFSMRLWRLRWLMYSHYFMRRYWLFPASSVSSISHEIQAENQDTGKFVYGETPFWTVRKILLWGGFKQGDTLLDLGCGRGGMVLFAALYFNATAVGVDLCGPFIRIGEMLSGKLNLKQVSWVHGDFLGLDFAAIPAPDFVYLAGTTFSWETIVALAKKLELLPLGAKVVSLSAKLPSRAFKEIGVKEFWFSWGKATAHLHERI